MKNKKTTKTELTLQTERRHRFLENLIKEAVVNVLREQEEQMAPAPAAVPPSPVAPDQLTNAAPQATPTDAQDPFTVDGMVEKLNVLRGGKSFTDPEIFGKLTTFFNNLTEEQRQTLEYFLEELGKIVIDATEQDVTGQPQPGAQPKQAPQQPAPQGRQGSQPATPQQAPTQAAPVSPTV